MTEETQQPQYNTVSDMVRTTCNNTNEFMLKIADHIDELMTANKQMAARINELEGQLNDIKPE
jgi:methyl-accepting chemotaxis protein